MDQTNEVVVNALSDFKKTYILDIKEKKTLIKPEAVMLS